MCIRKTLFPLKVYRKSCSLHVRSPPRYTAHIPTALAKKNEMSLKSIFNIKYENTDLKYIRKRFEMTFFSVHRGGLRQNNGFLFLIREKKCGAHGRMDIS